MIWAKECWEVRGFPHFVPLVSRFIMTLRLEPDTLQSYERYPSPAIKNRSLNAAPRPRMVEMWSTSNHWHHFGLRKPPSDCSVPSEVSRIISEGPRKSAGDTPFCHTYGRKPSQHSNIYRSFENTTDLSWTSFKSLFRQSDYTRMLQVRTS